MPGLMRIVHGCVALVVCGEALIASCTVLKSPVPSPATTGTFPTGAIAFRTHSIVLVM